MIDTATLNYDLNRQKRGYEEQGRYPLLLPLL